MRRIREHRRRSRKAMVLGRRCKEGDIVWWEV
jgi:hypothetical protein